MKYAKPIPTFWTVVGFPSPKSDGIGFHGIRVGKKSSPSSLGKSSGDRRTPDKGQQSRAPENGEDVMQELEQLRDRFRKTTNALASAAHDLKTPLAILNGYIELLQSQKLGPLNERQREVMGDMFSSGQRLEHFIQDFLTFSVIEIGELRMQYVEGDMNACLSEVCRLWSGRFQERGLALYFLANDKLTTFAFDGPRFSGSFPICWRTHGSTRRKVGQCGCMRNRICGNGAA